MSREGAVSISGEVVRVDGAALRRREGAVGEALDEDMEIREVVERVIDGEDDTSHASHQSDSHAGDGGVANDANGGGANNGEGGEAPPAPAAPPPPPTTVHPSAPRLLSTCLGTASPLAWTCRYSAPAATVQLVLALDARAVRRCLPQLGTPLHECVGRPRPLRTMPLQRGKWARMVGDARGEGAAGALPGALGGMAAPPTTKKKRKQRGRNKAPKILAGLREWRRTVRALIRADEALAKEDATHAALTASQENAAEAIQEAWRTNVRGMIKDNVDNIQRYKRMNSADEMDDTAETRGAADAEGDVAKGGEQSKPPAVPYRRPVRATLAQDADGNTPLHFMVRGAAAPAFGGGRWQARHGVEDGGFDDESDDDDDDDEEDDDTDGNDREGNAMELDESAGGEDAAPPDPRSALRDIECRGTSGSSWDGVRWCMEAHLRRAERRLARRMRAPTIEGQGESDGPPAGPRESDASEDDANASDGERGRRALASVRIGSPVDGPADEAMDAADCVEGEEVKLPAKRKSLDLGAGNSVKTSRVDASAAVGSAAPTTAAGWKSDAPTEEGSAPAVPPRKKPPRRKKYLDPDERQDCAYDPLLGAVRDLVHSCPEAVGTPDHREYEETPLIVALKSSIYVVAEPEPAFPLGAPPGGPGEGAAVAGGDGFHLFGGILGPVAGGGPGGGGPGIDRFGGGGAGFGGFPFPELGALIHPRPFGIFPDDEAMMAVLRGHGRRVHRDDALRRRSAGDARRTAAAGNPVAAPAATGSGAPSAGEGGSNKEGGSEEDVDDDASAASSVSDAPSLAGRDPDDPRLDAFLPGATERLPGGGEAPGGPAGGPAGALGPAPRRRPRYDYQTALEYRVFCLVRIMLDAHPRAACLLISDYTPLHSAVFHGRCPDTIRLLLDAEARFWGEANATNAAGDAAPQSAPHPPGTAAGPQPCPTLAGPAALCTNTRGELPLHFACMRNESARTIKLLSEADPRAALVRDAAGRTPLRWLWVRFVDGLLDRFGGRDTRGGDGDGRNAGEENRAELEFEEQEGHRGVGMHFPVPGAGAATTGAEDGSVDDALGEGDGGRPSSSHPANRTASASDDEMFVFDAAYLRRTRDVDRTVDFLRMRHVPSGFESIEYVAAEHAITVLLKLKYLRQRRERQREAARGSRSRANPPPEVAMSIKEEFILCAFQKFAALIYAALVAAEAEEGTPTVEATAREDDPDLDEGGAPPARKRLWHTLPRPARGRDPHRRFLIVHEACGASRASCPAAVAKICLRLFAEQLHRRDADGRLPLHRACLRGVGWEPPGSDGEAPSRASLADETLTLLREVIAESPPGAAGAYDENGQLPLHCAIDAIVTSLVMGKRRRASLHAEARVALQQHRRQHVNIATACLSELLHRNAGALQRRDGRTKLYPFMQAATPHVEDRAVARYASDLSRRPGFDVGVGYAPMDGDVVEEDDEEGARDHVTVVYYLLREDPSAVNGLGLPSSS
ncbi:hypothetical protein ACHAXT_004418 [Thalassiosira profunda]